MKKIELILRFILAIILLIFGLNKFLHFLKPPLNEAEAELMGAMVKAGYFMPTVGIVFIVCAVLLIANRAIPFALTLLAPIMVNIVFFHLFQGGYSSMLPGLLISAIIAVLAWSRRGAFVELFSSRAPSRESD